MSWSAFFQRVKKSCEHFLKFRCSLCAMSCCEVRLSPDIRGIEASDFGKECRARHREIVGNSSLQSLDGVRRRTEVGRGAVKLTYNALIGKWPLQIWGRVLLQALSSPKVHLRYIDRKTQLLEN